MTSPWHGDRGLHGHVVRVLGTRIVSGHHRPGDTLAPEDVQREFAVSRTVVREAFKVLAAKGLIDARPRRGTYVTPRAGWKLLDREVLRWQFEDRGDADFFQRLDEVRGIIEPASARLAARRRDQADLARMDEALAAMAGASTDGKDGSRFTAADLRFHSALLTASHNELLECMQPVVEAGLAARDVIVHGRSHWPDSIPAHSRVLEAVRAGDAAGAERAMRSLLAQATRDLASTRSDLSKREEDG